MPTRVQRTRIKGQPGMPPGAVYVGRGTRWGNPWRIIPTPTGLRIIGPYGDPWARPASTDEARKIATDAYRQYAPGVIEDLAAAARTELAGHDLACWCPLPEPGQPDHCHGAVLLALANPGGA